VTSPRVQFDWTVTLGSVVSTLLWIGGAVWFASTLTGQVNELQRARDDHAVRLRAVEREGSEVARADHKRIEIIERRMEASDATLAQMRDLLSRIDENVKALKEQQPRVK